ncbi:hypothetical protein DFQ30_008524 [Apophysomyces sp. BC1015]|nr:hypothetical protein DFQ30_008524 [Apophysomyces sp. BC1015]
MPRSLAVVPRPVRRAGSAPGRLHHRRAQPHLPLPADRRLTNTGARHANHPVNHPRLGNPHAERSGRPCDLKDGGDVYDWTQTDDALCDGDVFVFAGVLVNCWPTLVAFEAEHLHRLEGTTWEVLDDGKYAAAAAVARKLAPESLGKPVSMSELCGATDDDFVF